jgi:hypothetical protein
MMSIVFLFMLLVPVATLMWRIVVTKSRRHWVRIGAATAAMVSAVGTFVVYGQIQHFSFADWRDVVALCSAMAASAYLVFLSLRRHANRRHRTISLIAAVIGVVPALGAIAVATFFQE